MNLLNVRCSDRRPLTLHCLLEVLWQNAGAEMKGNLLSDNHAAKITTGFPCGSAGKESACNAGHLGSIPGLGRCPGEGKGYPLQYSDLEN